MSTIITMPIMQPVRPVPEPLREYVSTCSLVAVVVVTIVIIAAAIYIDIS